MQQDPRHRCYCIWRWSSGNLLSCDKVANSHDIYNNLSISFPDIPGVKLRAHIDQEHCSRYFDVAFLQLEGKLPEQAAPAILSETITYRDNYQSFGFGDYNHVDGGMYSAGTIQGETYENARDPLNKIIQLTIDHNRSEVPHGMSVAPVLDTTNRVIGIIRASSDTQTHDYAIPVKSIVNVYSNLAEKNPGLKRIFDFLIKIGEEGIRKVLAH